MTSPLVILQLGSYVVAMVHIQQQLQPPGVIAVPSLLQSTADSVQSLGKEAAFAGQLEWPAHLPYQQRGIVHQELVAEHAEGRGGGWTSHCTQECAFKYGWYVMRSVDTFRTALRGQQPSQCGSGSLAVGSVHKNSTLHNIIQQKHNT